MTASRKKKDPPQPALKLTGDRRNDRFRICLYGRPAELTGSSVYILVELILARADSETGFVPLSPVEVHRLRRALDDAGGAGSGKRLIETGAGEEYRLALAPEELAEQVVLEASFFELTRMGVLTGAQAGRLQSGAGLASPTLL
jgi:hypothetical protein